MDDHLPALIYRLTAPQSLEIVEEPLPSLESGKFIGQTVFSVVSTGTELAAWRGEPPIRDVQQYPRLVGYCNLAQVIETQDSDVKQWDHVLTHQSHRSKFCVPVTEVLAMVPRDPRYATAYLYTLANRVFQGHDEPEIAVVGFGALGYAVADLARCRAIKATVYSDRETTLVDTRRKRADRTYRHVVLTSSQWDDYDLALSLATDRVTILGFPGRSEPTTSNPLRGLYPKGLTLRQIGERPLGRDLREIVDLMPYLRPEPLIERRVSWKDLGTVYRDRGPWLSALLEW